MRVAGEVRNTDETFEAVGNCLGVVLLAAGNASIYQRPDVVTVAVSGLSPAQLAVVWRRSDTRAPVHDFIDACRSVAAGRRSSRGRDSLRAPWPRSGAHRAVHAHNADKGSAVIPGPKDSGVCPR